MTGVQTCALPIYLSGRVDRDVSRSFIDDEPFIEDLFFHGSFVSALIASNGIAMASVAPNARLCAVKVLSFEGSGSFEGVSAGIVYAATPVDQGGAGADVINMSLGAYVDRTDPEVRALLRVQQKAINYAWDRGVLVVVSAGNSAIDLRHDLPNLLEVPAELAHVLNIGATAPINQQNFDLLASYSNYGTTDLSAPGGDLVAGGQLRDLVLSVCSTYTLYFNCSSGRRYLLGAGTSFAAPHVSGAGAVLMSVSSRHGEPDEFVEALKEGADRVGPRLLYGAGRLNVLRSLKGGEKHDGEKRSDMAAK